MRLLNISASFPLLDLRGAFLAALGFEVANALGAFTGMWALRFGRKCDATILCHTLSNADKLRFEAVIQGLQPRPSLVELYLVEMPVTSGISLDAAVDFSPFVNRWAESLDVHQRVSPFDPTYKDGHCSPMRFIAGPHSRAALRSLTWPSNRKLGCVGNS